MPVSAGDLFNAGRIDREQRMADLQLRRFVADAEGSTQAVPNDAGATQVGIE
jgi:hypothetical protein